MTLRHPDDTKPVEVAQKGNVMPTSGVLGARAGSHETPKQPANHAPTDALDVYFRQTTGKPRLSPPEERRLALELRALKTELWTSILTCAELRDHILRYAHRTLSKLPDRVTAAGLALADRDGDVLHEALDWLDEHQPHCELTCKVRVAERAFKRARDRFVAANLGLVVTIAKRYDRSHLTLADLIQEGNTGLLKAVDRFDPDRGFRFSTYAVWWIRHAIGRALSDKSREIRLPVHVTERLQVVSRARATIELRRGRPATPQDIAGETGLRLDQVKDLLSVEYSKAESTDKRTAVRGALDVDTLASNDDEPDFDQGVLCEGLRAAVEHLPEVQRDIIRRRFGLDGEAPMTLREVGQRHHLSRERIRQLQERALATMRAEFHERGLD